MPEGNERLHRPDQEGEIGGEGDQGPERHGAVDHREPANQKNRTTQERRQHHRHRARYFVPHLRRHQCCDKALLPCFDPFCRSSGRIQRPQCGKPGNRLRKPGCEHTARLPYLSCLRLGDGSCTGEKQQFDRCQRQCKKSQLGRQHKQHDQAAHQSQQAATAVHQHGKRELLYFPGIAIKAAHEFADGLFGLPAGRLGKDPVDGRTAQVLQQPCRKPQVQQGIQCAKRQCCQANSKKDGHKNHKCVLVASHQSPIDDKLGQVRRHKRRTCRHKG